MAQTTNPSFPSPRILGIATAGMLSARLFPDALWACNGVELRADGLPPEDILPALRDFTRERHARGFDGLVLFTLRLRRDGGFWEDAAAGERETLWRALPPGMCDFADMEIEEAPGVESETFRALRDAGAGVLLSHHAFTPEPPAAWDRALEKMRALRPDAVKFAVAVGDSGSAAAVLRLARRVAAEFPSSCVIGMGDPGRATRAVGPLLGCPWTYGFLGHSAVAPGQLSAAALREFFRRANLSPARPAAEAPEEDWLAWGEELLAETDSASRTEPIDAR